MIKADVVSVWQVLPGTPSAPPIPAQRVARCDDHCTRNCLLQNKLHQRYSRFIYNPLKKIQAILLAERSAIQQARQTQIRSLFGSNSYDKLSSMQQDPYPEAMQYYDQIQCPQFTLPL